MPTDCKQGIDCDTHGEDVWPLAAGCGEEEFVGEVDLANCFLFIRDC